MTGNPQGDDGTWQVICLGAAAVMYLSGVVRRPASDEGAYSAGWIATGIDVIRLPNPALQQIYRETSWCLCRAHVWEGLPQSSQPSVGKYLEYLLASFPSGFVAFLFPLIHQSFPRVCQLLLNSAYLSSAQVTVFALRRGPPPPRPPVSSSLLSSSAATAPTGLQETALASIPPPNFHSPSFQSLYQPGRSVLSKLGHKSSYTSTEHTHTHTLFTQVPALLMVLCDKLKGSFGNSP